MASPKTVAIVPVRFIPSAKHRLANSMTASFRQQLVHAMLRDVIKGIKETTCINQVILVTRDTDFIADNLDGQYKLHQSLESGLNQELTEIVEILKKRGSYHVIIILADIPLITGKILDEIVRTSLNTGRPLIAQDWTGTGTNILCFPITTKFTFHFGVNSLQQHKEQLQAVGLTPIIYHSIETALDIDDDQAILQFNILAHTDERFQNTTTYRLLQSDGKRKGKAA